MTSFRSIELLMNKSQFYVRYLPMNDSIRENRTYYFQPLLVLYQSRWPIHQEFYRLNFITMSQDQCRSRLDGVE